MKQILCISLLSFFGCFFGLFLEFSYELMVLTTIFALLSIVSGIIVMFWSEESGPKVLTTTLIILSSSVYGTSQNYLAVMPEISERPKIGVALVHSSEMTVEPYAILYGETDYFEDMNFNSQQLKISAAVGINTETLNFQFGIENEDKRMLPYVTVAYTCFRFRETKINLFTRFRASNMGSEWLGIQAWIPLTAPRRGSGCY